MPESLAKQSKENAEAMGYANIQELALEGLRKINRELENQRNIAFLRTLQGRSKGPYLTKKQRYAMSEMSEKEQLEIFREFGLD